MKRILITILKVLGVLAALWLLAGWGLSGFITRAKKNVRIWEEDGTPPIRSVRFQTSSSGKVRSIIVKTATNTPLSQVVNLGVFGQFRPGVPLDEISRQFGPPVKVGKPQSSQYPPQKWQYFTFTNPTAEIQVLMGLSGAETNWTVIAAPPESASPFAITGVLAGEVLKHLPTKDRDLTLWVFDGNETELVDCEVKGDTVQSIRWAIVEKSP